jgi:hypothetical protein
MTRMTDRATAVALLIVVAVCATPWEAAASVRLAHPLAGASGVSTAAPLDTVVYDYGFLAALDTTTTSNRRLRVLGPFIESQTNATGLSFHAVRPFYSHTDDPARGRGNTDILWPLAQAKDLDDQRFWRFLVFYGNDFDTATASTNGRYRTVLFPIAAYGRDKEGEGYGAVFPLGGEVHEFLGQDRISFVLFPCYLETEVSDVKGRAVLWPIIAWARGDRMHRFRVFPFYGKSVRDHQWEKRFVLWPFWTSVEYDYPDEKGGGYVLFPIWGHIETPRHESWMAIPPFFRYSRAEHDVREWRCPWPFVQYGKRPDKEYMHLWPFWGNTETKETSRSYALWPIFWWRTVDNPGDRMSSFYALPFVYSQTHTLTPAPPAAAGSLFSGAADPTPPPAQPAPDAAADAADPEIQSRYWKVWPLMSYRREGDAWRFRTLELWPAKFTRGVEQNWAPLWTLYRQEAVGKATEQELLWGLFRHSRSAEGRTHCSVFPLFSRDGSDDRSVSGWSVLGGLFGARREGLDKEYRFLYLLKFRTGPLSDSRDTGGSAEPLPGPEAGQTP